MTVNPYEQSYYRRAVAPIGETSPGRVLQVRETIRIRTTFQQREGGHAALEDVGEPSAGRPALRRKGTGPASPA